MSRAVGKAQRPAGWVLSGDLEPNMSCENKIWEMRVVTLFLAEMQSMISHQITSECFKLADVDW